MTLFWKITEQYKKISTGTVVGQVKDVSVKSSLRSTLTVLRRANPGSKFEGG